MTALLERAFEHARVLPEALQDDIAAQWLQELEWNAAFAASQPLLEPIGAERVARQSGRTRGGDGIRRTMTSRLTSGVQLTANPVYCRL
ncbi:hypothetical protein U14_04998 [Candidatus Moduliflexus flocculans]|uniref:Uncharacterized protein n=1 Tax=Candidatus Moduliflexus flocculans TaxID=1499966 RepID=A0A081BQP3_9BACT|nr:hypothetical protein U14_04998 [Candidatus Moduliflexus flocculans]